MALSPLAEFQLRLPGKETMRPSLFPLWVPSQRLFACCKLLLFWQTSVSEVNLMNNWPRILPGSGLRRCSISSVDIRVLYLERVGTFFGRGVMVCHCLGNDDELWVIMHMEKMVLTTHTHTHIENMFILFFFIKWPVVYFYPNLISHSACERVHIIYLVQAEWDTVFWNAFRVVRLHLKCLEIS